MKNFTSILIISLSVFFTIFSNSCNRCEKGSGHILEIKRPVAPFDGISMVGSYEVVIIPDSIQYILVSGDDNFLPYIKTEVRAGILEIGSAEHNKCIKNYHTQRVEVHTSHLKNVGINGSGKITAQGTIYDHALQIAVKGSGDIDINFEGKSINATIDGSGIIRLNGKVDKADFSINGSGEVNAFALISKQANTGISGSGKIEVAATEKLDVKISGSGRVNYTGTPSMKVQISGSGKVDKS